MILSDFLKIAQQYKENIAVVSENNKLTYEELEALARKIATRLKNNGLKKGDFITIELPKDENYIAAMIASWMVGAAFAALGANYPLDRLDFIASDCKAKIRINLEFLKDIEKEKPIGKVEENKEFDSSLLIYTSGSTGRPKGVLHTHLSISDAQIRIREIMKKTVDDCQGLHFGASAPLSFVAGIQLAFYSLCNGLVLYLIPTEIVKDAASLSNYIYDNKINIAFMPPKVLKVYKNKGNSLKAVMTGSEKVTNIYRKDFQIINGYGSSESTGALLFFIIDKEYDNTPVGNTIYNTNAYILDDDGKENDKGEICLTGNFAIKYLNLEEQTNKTFIKNPFKNEDGFEIMLKTGDIGQRLSDGNILYLNRKDWLIKINGQRVEPGEIEAVIKEIPTIFDAVVKDFKGNANQTIICAYYVEKSKTNVEDIKAHLNKKLPSYMIPAFFIKLDKLPVNANGKLDRNMLLPPDLNDVRGEYVAPTNEIEKALCEAFEKSLGIDKVGILDDFFNLGGDSIRVMSLQNILPNIGLTTKIIYENRNAKNIALKLNNEKLEKFDINKAYPLTQAQLGIFLTSQKNEGKACYNNPILMSLSKKVDIEKLASSVKKTILAHKGLLATIFIDELGNPLMKYNKEFLNNKLCSIEKMSEADLEKEKPNLEQPFYLTKEPLFRFRIIQTEKNNYLFMDIHHVIFDGYSFHVIINDIIKAYDGKEINDETYTAFDEAIKESNERKSIAYENAKKWYLDTFGDVDEVTLPEGDLKQNETTFGLNKSIINIKYKDLKDYCTKNNTTENVVTSSAFGILLSSYTMAKNAYFATVYNGRHDLTSKDTVSMFVRTLPVLCPIKPNLNIKEYLDMIKDQMLSSMVNDIYSFSDLAASTGYSSDVLFTWQGDLFDLPKLENEKIKTIDIPFNATGEKLSIQIYPKDEFIELNIQYHSNLYSDEWINKFVKNYEQALINILTKNKMADVSLIDDKTTKDIIKLSYGGDLVFDKSKTFIDLFKEQALLYPNNIAVVDKFSSYTYKELDNLSNIVANYLVSEKINNEFVAIKMHRLKEFIVAIIGIQKSGNAYIPIDPSYPEDRISYMVDDSKARVVFDEKLINKVLKDNKNNKDINLSSYDIPAYMIYTSGSTGKPKGVVVPHRALEHLIAWNINTFKLNKDSRNAAHASFSFDASVIDIFPVLTVGGGLYIMDEELRMDLDLIKNYLDKNKISGMNSSTAIGMSLINAHPEIGLNYFIMGGEKMLPLKKTKVNLYNGYGPTEFAVCSSYHLVDQNKETDIPIGRAVPNTYSFVCDMNGNLLPLGMVGELCLSGPQIALGYWKREELTNERFCDCNFLKGEKMYRTGDLARYNANGELEYMGRIDFQVKLRGFRIELGEIENCASQYEGILQTAAVVKMNQLILYYTASSPIDEDELKNKMGESLTEYMVPNIFMKLDEMPMTPNGKINRKALPDADIKAKEIIEPKTDDEKKIFECLKDVLGYSDFGITTDFKLAGLTSLSSMQFSARLSQMYDKSIRINDLVNYPTIEKLAKFINEKDNDDSFELRKYYPLSMAQKGVLTEVLQYPETTIYNLPLLIELPKGLNIDKLIDSIKKVINAHPYLKTKLLYNDEGNIVVERLDDDEVIINKINEDVDPNTLVKPFDLFKENLYRIIIINNNKLFFDAHHIAFDGESLDIFLHDLSEAYAGKELLKESFTGFEVALDEEARHQGKLLDNAKEWYGKLIDGVDVDCLPVADFNNKDGIKNLYQKDALIDNKVVNKLLNDNKITINSLWISAFSIALARFLNRNNVIFTTVYNGRNDARMQNSIGMFVHTLPVVLKPFAATDSISFVKDTALQIQTSMANDIYGFMEIAHDLEVRADILFVYEGKIGSGWSIDKYSNIELKLLPSTQVKSTILFAITELENGYRLNVEYDGKKYQEWSIKSLVEATILSFNAIIKNEKIEDISLLTNEAKLELDEFNKTEADVLKTDLISLFRNRVKENPNNIAVIYEDKKLTYKELDLKSDIIASYLASKGIGKGSVVSIMVKRSENMAICPLAVMKTGAAYQPLDCTYPIERLEFMIKDANASLIIADEDLLNKIPNNKLPLLLTKDFDKLPKDIKPLKGPSYNDLMILLYTSGTTGIPKGVMLSQFNLVNFCTWYKKYYNLTSESVVSAYASFGFDACMMDLYSALTNGAAVCIVPEDMRMNLGDLKNYFNKNKVSHTFITTQVGRLFAEENSKCDTLKHLSVGGEKLVPLNKLPEGYTMYNGYGPTECTIFSTIEPYNKPWDRIPIGKALDNYKLYVVDSNFHQVPVGALGELWIAGYGVGMGYLNQPEKTKASFIDNPFCKTEGFNRVYRTGDIVRRLNDGKIDFIGRNDGQVKIRGFRIELGEVELVIRDYPDIKDVTVQAFREENNGAMYLAAYFTSPKKIDISKIKEFILEQKPPYMVPASIMQIDSIPLNQNQKVNKKALPKPVFTEDNKDYIEPETPIEKNIANIYHELLGIDKVSATDSFFSIGGTSLSAAKVVMSALNKGYSIAYKDIFDNPSPRELAALIESRTNNIKTEIKEEHVEEISATPLMYNDVKYVDDIKLERPLGKVLLAGATGFLGIHLLKELLNNKIKTIVLVRGKNMDPLARLKGLLMYYFDSPLENEIKEYITVVDSSITDNNLLSKVKDYQFDTILNAAACVKHFAQDDIIERTNVGGVLNLIEVAKAKHVRLIQVSTLSVAGENVDHKFPENYLMKENQLYFGQDISNKYVNSKFKAEEAILKEIEYNKLDAKIIRVGNLMSRQSDGEFQINSITNSFMKSLKGYKVLAKFPIALLDNKIDFSPIDEIAKTILLLSQTPEKFTVFHSVNSHQVQMGDVIDAMNLAGIKIDKVNQMEFNKAIKEAMNDDKKSSLISTLFSYANQDNHTYEFIQADFTFTVKALYRLGYRWPITDFDYLTKAIDSLNTLDFFDREDI